MSEKTCSRCGLTKLLAAFKFDGSRQRHRTICRDCDNAHRRDRYAAEDKLRLKAQERSARYQQQIKCAPDGLQAARAREQRREYKRLGRICGKPGYKPAKHDAHVQCWVEWTNHQQTPPVLHDAHVVLARADPGRWWHLHEKHRPGMASARRRRRQQARDTLADSYLTRLLTNGRTSCPISAGIPQSLIELKRAHLRLVRHLNQQEGETQ